ncbi:ParB/RepB/Spo0J family partition protein [Cupriavidus respiraculi]|uniref:Nucleoid occlusion protein n=1 Tax=Cupriavidus respiraculi TaxID=195930 RepID=A0ABM8XVF1_9BURK|nr:ParB/RepB/Spo0J family partition protein [Cupriavidus respiraculi]CAG9184381.1 Nucleoid occlusion protein [Cupriavidus respiraculi]
MATKGKKNFLDSLEAGAERDQAIRQTAALDRFDRVDDVLSGRTNLLQTGEGTSAKPSSANESFHVETLVAEGRASSRYARIPLDLIDDNPLNSRKFYDENKVKARAASIAAEGQMVPAPVAPNPTKQGRYTLIDGHYRKKALLHLNHSDMECRILEGLSPVDFYKLAHLLNNEREQESILDVAFSYRQLLNAGIAKTDEELVPIVGESKAKISKMLALVELPQSVLDVITENPDAFGVSVGYELTLYNKVAGEDKTAELAQRIAAERLPFTKVEAIRKKAEEGTRAKRNTSRQYKIMRAGQPIGTLKEWDNGRVTVDMTFDDPAKREAYVASLLDETK